MVFRDRPVRREISETVRPSRRNSLLTLPNISMVITSDPPPQNEAGRLNTLVNFQSVHTLSDGQFSVGANTCTQPAGCTMSIRTTTSSMSCSASIAIRPPMSRN